MRCFVEHLTFRIRCRLILFGRIGSRFLTGRLLVSESPAEIFNVAVQFIDKVVVNSLRIIEFGQGIYAPYDGFVAGIYLLTGHPNIGRWLLLHLNVAGVEQHTILFISRIESRYPFGTANGYQIALVRLGCMAERTPYRRAS